MRKIMRIPSMPVLPTTQHQVVVSPGFTVVEILVGAILVAVVGSMAASVMMVSNRATVSSTSMANWNAAIDDDISKIKVVAERFTCCSGTCTADTSAIATAIAAGTCEGGVGDSAYYFPKNPNANTTQASNFTSACSSGLTTNLISQIPSASLPTGITRAVVDDGEATARRIRITYTGTGINRVVKIIPTVSSWCP